MKITAISFTKGGKECNVQQLRQLACSLKYRIATLMFDWAENCLMFSLLGAHKELKMSEPPPPRHMRNNDKD